MMKSVPVSLVVWRSLPKTPLVVVFLVVALTSISMSVLRLVNLHMVFDAFGVAFDTCDHPQRYHIGGSVSSKVMFSVAFPSNTALAVVCVVSLEMIPICNFSLPMRVRSLIFLWLSVVGLLDVRDLCVGDGCMTQDLLCSF